MANSKHKRGFTVIELLAAMAVVVFIVLLMTRIFTETTGIWSRGAKQVQDSAEARAIMDYIVTEMTQAIADDVVSFKLNSGGTNSPPQFGVSAYGADSDEVCFVALVRSGDVFYKRAANQIVYFISPMLDENSQVMTNRFRLAKARRTRSMFLNNDNRDNDSAYRNANWWTASNLKLDKQETGAAGLTTIETIAENVAGFEVWAWNAGLNRYEFGFDSSKNGNELPLWVDIYLELLDEPEAIRAAALWPVDPTAAAEYVNANVRRYTSRVFFPNRERARAFK